LLDGRSKTSFLESFEVILQVVERKWKRKTYVPRKINELPKITSTPAETHPRGTKLNGESRLCKMQRINEGAELSGLEITVTEEVWSLSTAIPDSRGQIYRSVRGRQASRLISRTQSQLVA